MHRWLTTQPARTIASRTLLHTKTSAFFRNNLFKSNSYVTVTSASEYSDLEGWTVHTLQETQGSRVLHKYTQAPVTLFYHKKSGASLVHIGNKNDADNFQFKYERIFTY